MIGSGAASVGILSIGIVLKFMHLPGAAVFLLLGIVTFSLIFLPLLFVLRIKENQQQSEKAISAIGGLSGMLISLGILFKIMHWPFANIMCLAALFLILAVFIPIYFFSGLRNPATKVNTVVSSILMFTGCILILTLIRRPALTHQQSVYATDYFFQNEQILKTERKQLALPETASAGEAIFNLSEELKSFILEKETGLKFLGSDFESKEALIGDTWANEHFKDAPDALKKLDQLEALIASYNQSEKMGLAIPINRNVFDLQEKVSATLNSFIQIQMVVLQNQRQLVAIK